ncbi:hypothetical protein [Qipengyuania atrilutea]|uniref:Uncharacterized protein n=1 Tax=Qipengyuania atrilutea TaxID=2744473 RepID=A0A850H185_9SPHN|nr:hypothetical protein [Actirhodobacter atriluteus]NVD45724.1 hypothetical protein [Actirhodobacter atriluteus]
MKGKGLFRRVGLTFVPASRDGREVLSEVGEGDSAFLEIWAPRNPRQHAKYFAVLNNVVEATGRWTSTEHLRRDILIALNRYDDHVSALTGEVTKIPHSMAYASMPKAEFEQLYTETMALLTEALGADPEMLTEQAA